MPGPVRNPTEAFQQLESIMLRQMLQSSGAFRAGSAPGAQLRTDMFVETLADAVAKAGGLGIAHMLERQLGGGSPAPASAPAAASFVRPQWSTGTPAGGGARGASVGAVDDLDDPNSEAPLPEDPQADSIDDYQPGARRPAAAAFARPTSDLTGDGGAASRSTGEVTDHVTSGFGPRVHPITGDVRFHTGVDLRANEGAPIRAAAGGIVSDAGHHGGYGNVVEIDHGNGTSTLYAHASSLLVARGQRVEEGQPVALVGHTGQATGPHLHFELRRNDHPVDPATRNLTPPIARALNRYRERVEASVAGTLFRAGDGGKP